MPAAPLTSKYDVEVNVTQIQGITEEHDWQSREIGSFWIKDHRKVRNLNKYIERVSFDITQSYIKLQICKPILVIYL